jgi:hypothetical protein
LTRYRYGNIFYRHRPGHDLLVRGGVAERPLRDHRKRAGRGGRRGKTHDGDMPCALPTLNARALHSTPSMLKGCIRHHHGGVTRERAGQSHNAVICGVHRNRAPRGRCSQESGGSSAVEVATGVAVSRRMMHHCSIDVTPSCAGTLLFAAEHLVKSQCTPDLLNQLYTRRWRSTRRTQCTTPSGLSGASTTTRRCSTSIEMPHQSNSFWQH